MEDNYININRKKLIKKLEKINEVLEKQPKIKISNKEELDNLENEVLIIENIMNIIEPRFDFERVEKSIPFSKNETRIISTSKELLEEISERILDFTYTDNLEIERKKTYLLLLIKRIRFPKILIKSSNNTNVKRGKLVDLSKLKL